LKTNDRLDTDVNANNQHKILHKKRNCDRSPALAAKFPHGIHASTASKNTPLTFNYHISIAPKDHLKQRNGPSETGITQYIHSFDPKAVGVRFL
jgi:hypothetical protein